MTDVKENEFGKAGYVQERSFIYVVFTCKPTSEAFRSIWNHALTLMRRYDINKWVVNESKLIIQPADRNWHQNEWFTQSVRIKPLSEENPRYIAVIPSEDAHLEFSTTKFIEASKYPGLVINRFENEYDARQWVNSFTASE